MKDPTTPETPVAPEPVTIHTLAATVAKFKALKEAAEKASSDLYDRYKEAEKYHNDMWNAHQSAQGSLLSFAELLDAGLSTAPLEPVETFSGAGAKA